MQEPLLIFEQPLNEYVRVCLRLEHLFARVFQNIKGCTESESRVALESMLEALNVIDRPDLKSKFTKALTQHAGALVQLEEKPGVDRQKLQCVLNEIDQLLTNLYKMPDKLGQQLRNNPFLSTVRLHMSNPGGACPFSTPAYYVWLRKLPEERIYDLERWFLEFNQLKLTVSLLLKLIRGSSDPQPLNAIEGFYQQPLDPKLSYNLVSVSFSSRYGVYPEISVGKHRLSVRFLLLNVHDKAAQTEQDVAFSLGCCLSL